MQTFAICTLGLNSSICLSDFENSGITINVIYLLIEIIFTPLTFNLPLCFGEFVDGARTVCLCQLKVLVTAAFSASINFV